jgi:hypothetical protein
VADNDERLVPVEDLATRRVLWSGVWDWLIQRCEELASQADSGGASELPDDADKLAAR